MKNASVEAAFFAAYPLRAVPADTADKLPNLNPYFQALLDGQAKNAGKANVYPMKNPYPVMNFAPLPKRFVAKKEVAAHGRDWFKSYE